MRHIKLKLDCDMNNSAEILLHQGAILGAMALFNSYIKSKNKLIGTGPELYAEQYMKSYYVNSTGKFNDLVMQYFVKILQVS